MNDLQQNLLTSISLDFLYSLKMEKAKDMEIKLCSHSLSITGK